MTKAIKMDNKEIMQSHLKVASELIDDAIEHAKGFDELQRRLRAIAADLYALNRDIEMDGKRHDWLHRITCKALTTFKRDDCDCGRKNLTLLAMEDRYHG